MLPVSVGRNTDLILKAVVTRTHDRRTWPSSFRHWVMQLTMRALIHPCLVLTLSGAVAYSQSSTNNIGTNAIATTSYVSPWENLLAIQNGRDPVSSTDKTGGAYGNWPTTGTNWVEYQWPSSTWPLGAG